MDDKKPKIDAGTIARSIILLLTLINAVLAFLGKDKIPFTEDGVYEWVTIISTIAATIWNWWENNAFTHNARKAEQYRKDLKSQGKNSDKQSETGEGEEHE